MKFWSLRYFVCLHFSSVWWCHPHLSHYLPRHRYFSLFGLFVAPVVAFERHTVVSLCGLSEECFDQCQLNSRVLCDIHCAAVYSKMWSSIYIRMHADFKLDVVLKGVCEVTQDYSCILHIEGCLRAFVWSVLCCTRPEKWPFSQSIGGIGRSQIRCAGKPRSEVVIVG